MLESPPDPPAELPDQFVRILEDSSTETIRETARFADQLVTYREQQVQEDDQSETEDAETRDVPEDIPDGVPAKASITTKEINDNRYHYWQWRDGDSIRSKYKGPADQSDSA